jgi:hypothetical protein
MGLCLGLSYVINTSSLTTTNIYFENKLLRSLINDVLRTSYPFFCIDAGSTETKICNWDVEEGTKFVNDLFSV